ncbi:MAG: hypothetical protein DMG07_06850 [Acidobacteria bacterium]|nr:MAG: hypothetical protein DMG07_06850 [Acidobacteriota bacterium]
MTHLDKAVLSRRQFVTGAALGTVAGFPNILRSESRSSGLQRHREQHQVLNRRG